MTKKEYCLTHEAIACHDYYRMQIHGIEYGINDYAYISRLYQKTVCGKTCVMFHKVKIHYDADGESYVKVNGRKFDGKREVITLNLENFIKTNSVITCKELEAFC